MTVTSQERITIETPRLRLRPLDLGDAATITALANNWNVVQHLSLLPFPYEERHAREFLTQMASQPVTTTFAVCLGTGERDLIGVMGVDRPQDGIARSFGYWLGEPWWGCGFATEAARGVIAFCINHLGAHTVESACRPANQASRNVLQKCGFVIAGKGTMPSKALGQETEVDLFTLTLDGAQRRSAADIAVTIQTDGSCTPLQSG